MRTSSYHLAVIFTLSLAAFVAGTSVSIADGLATLEAESGTLGADWATVSGTPTYITINTDLAGEAPTNAARVASYSVTFPTAGTYNLFGRVRVGADPFNDDSFYYGNGFGVKSPTDAAAWIKCNNLVDAGFTNPSDVVTGAGTASSNVWKWINFSTYTGASGETPITFTVPAGNLTQTFQIGARENGFLIDKFAFGTAGLPFTVLNLDNGTVPPPNTNVSYEIGTWRGFRPAAITYTFDDNLPNQYALALPMFNAAGLKMTLYTVSGWVSSWANAKIAASYGHEIGSHTVSHPSLSTVSASQLVTELADSQTAINQNITNQSCLTVAYPNCTVPTEATVAQYYVAARICSGQLVPKTPANFMQISSYILGSQGTSTASGINTLADNAANANAWCVYLIHAVDNESGGYSPLASTVLQASVNYMSANRNKFWVETFGNVVRYIKERNASSVSEISNNGSIITVQVTNNLNNAIYNYPITIRRPLPPSWPVTGVTGTQNGQPISVQVTNNFIMFDAVPNAGNVLISGPALPPVLSNPVLTPPDTLTIGLTGQSNANYALYGSSDLLNWLPIQTNRMAGTFTNLTLPASNSMQFYRALWVP